MPTTTNRSAVTAAEELCEQYRSKHDLDVRVTTHGHIVLRTGAVDAIQMPRELGDRVRGSLAESDTYTPIVENVRTDYLTFMTGPAPRGDARPVHLHKAVEANPSAAVAARTINADLYRLAAIRTVAGSEIPLPGPDDPVRKWLCPPTGVLADFDRVAALTIAAGSASLRRQGVEPVPNIAINGNRRIPIRLRPQPADTVGEPQQQSRRR
jgi:hypothetical protein